MKKAIFAGLVLCLSLAIVATGLGYATVTDSLHVEGNAQATPPQSVYITDASVISGTVQIKGYSETVLSSTVILGTTATASATVQLTVKNNTPYGYVFNQTVYQIGEQTFDNSGIAVKANIAKGTKLDSGATTTFTATFTYKNGISDSSVLNSVINFQFVLGTEYIPEVAVDNAMQRFEQIINDETHYEALIDAMNHTNAARPSTRPGSTTYIGNVIGSSGEDSQVINDLFTIEGENFLHLEINGKKTNVTVIIKREDVDGISGDEMTLYMTPETISGRIGTYITVYAIVFTQNTTTGKWEQLGELYAGEAPIVKYDGTWYGTPDSFTTDNWRTTQTYYNLRKGQSIQTIITAYKATL